MSYDEYVEATVFVWNKLGDLVGASSADKALLVVAIIENSRKDNQASFFAAATSRQKQVLAINGIKYDDSISKGHASALIDENMKKAGAAWRWK